MNAEKQSPEAEEQGKILWTLNLISRKLLSVQSDKNFESLVRDCLCLIGESIYKSRVYIWRDETDADGITYCKKFSEWRHDGTISQNHQYTQKISYDELPAFKSAGCGDKCFNSALGHLSAEEIKILSPENSGVIMIIPITINVYRWGFIGVDNYKDNAGFTSIEENMLVMCGSLLASAIEKMNTEAELREMEEHTQLMLNATPLCCNLWTSDFYNMRCNDEAVRLFDLSSQEEYLERFNELSPEFQPNARLSSELAKEHIEKAFKEGYRRFEWMHRKLDGTPVPSEITLVRIKYKDDFIVAGYTRDLREEKAMLAELKTKEALRIARDEALSNSKAKSNFLANMSHEIRSPMNAISGFAEIILRENASEKTGECAKGIKDACSNLLNIVNDILDITKIESGKLELYNSSYELASLLNDVISITRMRLGHKPLMFTTNIDSRLPAKLYGDETRIKQILINILSNACKYTQKGYFSLRVTSTVIGTQAMLHFSVKDSGVGIKTEDLDRLFEEFERVNTTKIRSIEGTGLGLAITKQLCEMMGGSIKVISTFGIGSEFIIDIPQECILYEPIAQVNESKNVLLYEPREIYRFSIIETLDNLECKCISCTNQSELYNSIWTMPFDYILTASLYLKKVQKILLKNRLQIPVAVFADYGETLNNHNIYTILFPINCLQLSVLLNGQLNGDGLYRRDSSVVNFTAPSARILVVDDNPVNLQVARGLMEPYQFTIDVAVNGVEAVKKIRSTKFDLVFMDHMMPEMDGIDATVAIRQLQGEYYQNLPIIALTANALVGTREMFIREGMNDFLAKPVEINKLICLLLKWLPQSKIVKPPVKENIRVQEKLPTWSIPGVHIAKGIAAIGGNTEKYIQILVSYYNDGKQKCSSLLQHIIKHDWGSFRTEVHAIKSTSSTIGAFQVSSLAAKLEAAAKNTDVTYIHENIESFISVLQALLEAIWPIISASLNQSILPHSTPEGDIAFLKHSLGGLKDYLEAANISLIEENLNHLFEYTWSGDITKELLAIQKCLSLYDYDSALERVDELNLLL